MKTSSLAMIPLALLTLTPPAMGMFGENQQIQLKQSSSQLSKEEKTKEQERDWELQLLTLMVLRRLYPDDLDAVLYNPEITPRLPVKNTLSAAEERHALAVAVASNTPTPQLTHQKNKDLLAAWSTLNPSLSPSQIEKEHLPKVEDLSKPVSLRSFCLLALQKSKDSRLRSIRTTLQERFPYLLGSRQIDLTLLGPLASHALAQRMFSKRLQEVQQQYAEYAHLKDLKKELLNSYSKYPKHEQQEWQEGLSKKVQVVTRWADSTRNLRLLESGDNVLGVGLGGYYTGKYQNLSTVLSLYGLKYLNPLFGLATEKNEEAAIRYLASLVNLYAYSSLYQKHFLSMEGFHFAEVADDLTSLVDLDNLPNREEQMRLLQKQTDLAGFRVHARKYFARVKQTPAWEKLPSTARALYKNYAPYLEGDEISFQNRIDAMVERIYTQWLAAQEKPLQGSNQEQQIQQVGQHVQAQVEEQKVDETPVKLCSIKKSKNNVPSLERSLTKFCRALAQKNPPVDLSFPAKDLFLVTYRDRKVKAGLEEHQMKKAYQEKIVDALHALNELGPQAQGFIHGKHILRLELSQGDRALLGVLYKTGDQHQSIASVTIEYVGNHSGYEDQSQAIQALLQKYQKKQALLGF